MTPLTKSFDEIVARYHGPEGDAFAIDELTPVSARFLPNGGRVLEIGCGYGRNLVALSAVPNTHVVGCDVAFDELVRAKARAAAQPEERARRISLARQEPFRLPFRDGTFDFVVLWQVLEHVIGHEPKRRVVHEAVRVMKSGGHLLVETPNLWFPVDYHDNNLPLVHWLLPFSARKWLTWKVRGQRYHPSEYLSLPGCETLIRTAPGVYRAQKATRVYFADSYRDAWRELAGTRLPLKRALFAMYWPLHGVLRGFGGSADWFLPSLRVVWRVDKQPTAAGSSA